MLIASGDSFITWFDGHVVKKTITLVQTTMWITNRQGLNTHIVVFKLRKKPPNPEQRTPSPVTHVILDKESEKKKQSIFTLCITWTSMVIFYLVPTEPFHKTLQETAHSEPHCNFTFAQKYT